MRGRREVMPDRVRLMSQTIHVEQVDNLHTPSGEWVHEGDEPAHTHKAYGVYEEAPQVITLDADLGFERVRDTFLHENIHAMLAIVGLDALLEGSSEGLGEHLTSVLSPVLLSWLRDNPVAVEWLQEVQA